MNKILKIILVAALEIFLLSSCASVPVESVTEERASFMDSTVSFGYELCGRETLEEGQRQMYDMWLSALKELNSVSIDLSAITTVEDAIAIQEVLMRITDDNPDIECYFDSLADMARYGGSIPCTCRWRSDKTTDKSTIQEGMKNMERISDEIISAMPADSSTYDKYLYLAEALCKNADYDEEFTDEGRLAYGALVNKKASCQGFRAAYQYLCMKCDLWCRGVNSSEHAWNMIRLEDGFYHMDVTWANGAYDDTGDYWKNYLFLTDDEIQRLEYHQIIE